MTTSPSRSMPPLWRKLGTSSAMLVGARIVTSVCSLIQVPLALRHLDAAAFGAWMACTSLLWTIGTIDFGLGFAVQNRMAALIAVNQSTQAATLGRQAQKWFGWVALGLLVIAPLVAYLGHWALWFGITDESLAGQLPAAICVVLIAAAVNLPLSIHHREAAALQMTWMSGLWTAVASLAALGAVALSVWSRAPLAVYAGASSLLLVGPAFATRLHVRRTLRRPADPTVSEADITGLARESALFLLPQLGAAFIGSFVPALVTLFAGPVAATVYSVLQKIYGFALQLLTLTLMPTWPAYSAAAARGDTTEVRHAFHGSLRVAWGLFVLPTLFLTPGVPALIRFWLGEQAPVIPLTLLWLVAGWNAIQMAGQPLAMLLNGLGRIAMLTYVGLGGFVLTIGLSTWWGSRWGAPGIVAALIVPYAFINIPLVSWQTACALRHLRANAT